MDIKHIYSKSMPQEEIMCISIFLPQKGNSSKFTALSSVPLLEGNSYREWGGMGLICAP